MDFQCLCYILKVMLQAGIMVSLFLTALPLFIRYSLPTLPYRSSVSLTSSISESAVFKKRFAILSIVLIGGFALWCSIYAKKLPGGIEGAAFGIGAYLPAIAILFIVLAIFGINKDERLIRSAETLR